MITFNSSSSVYDAIQANEFLQDHFKKELSPEFLEWFCHDYYDDEITALSEVNIDVEKEDFELQVTWALRGWLAREKDTLS